MMVIFNSTTHSICEDASRKIRLRRRMTTYARDVSCLMLTFLVIFLHFCTIHVQCSVIVGDNEEFNMHEHVYVIHSTSNVDQQGIESISTLPLGITMPEVYYALGPFPIGVREIGSDILESFQSIDAIWNDFVSEGYNSSTTFPSEIADGGRVGWKRFYPSNDSSSTVTIAYGEEDGIRWEMLTDPLGHAGYMFYSWIFATFHVRDDGKVLLNCISCSSFSIDGKTYMGDIYGIGYGWNILKLSAGYHTIRIRKAGMQSTSFSLQFQSLANPEYMIKSDTILPSMTNSHVYGRYIAITLLNTADSTLEHFSVTLTDTHGVRRPASFVSTPRILPGQSAIVQIRADLSDIHSFVLHIDTEKRLQEPLKLNITLPSTDSNIFYYTYLDIDRTVQYAAAIPPRKPCEQMSRGRCPVIIATHGAGSRSEWLIRYYNQQDYSWIVAPSGRRRYGYDWTGPQLANIYAALDSLESVITNEQRNNSRPDLERIVFTGHSMGGHGCYLASTMDPDNALASLCVAGWTTHHQYIPYFTRNDISFTDSILKGLLESAIYEHNPDLHLENLKGVPFMTRVGSMDDVVSPWHSRRMARIYSQVSEDANAAIMNEVPGMGHWWDQVVHDSDTQQFFDKYLQIDSPVKPTLPKVFTIVCTNPHGFKGRGGIRPLQLTIPFRLSKIHVIRNSDTEWLLKTSNIRRFGINKVHGLSLPTTVRIDHSDPILVGPNTLPNTHFCKEDETGTWKACENLTWQLNERNPDNYGPMRIVYERSVVLVIGTQGPIEDTRKHEEFAITLSNQFYLVGRHYVPIIKDSDFVDSEYSGSDSNLILLGGPHTNLVSRTFSKYFPVKFQTERNILTIGDYVFNSLLSPIPGPLGCIFLSGFPNLKVPDSANQLTRLALVITGTDVNGFELASKMMPLGSGLHIPDYLIVTKDIKAKGAGGIAAAGYWNNFWGFDLHSGYVDELLTISAPKNIVVPPPVPKTDKGFNKIHSSLITIGMLLLVSCCLASYLSLCTSSPKKKPQASESSENQLQEQEIQQNPEPQQQTDDTDRELDEIDDDIDLEMQQKENGDRDHLDE